MLSFRLLSYPGPHPPLLCAAGALQLLTKAQASFLAATSTLRQRAHSSYQRSIARTLTQLGIMHQLEDTTTGACVCACVCTPLFSGECQCDRKPPCPGARVGSGAPAASHPSRPDAHPCWYPPRAGYAIDITIPSQRIAIEADGPTHMARTGPPTRPLGATAMKARHLSALGWVVVNVGFQQWNALSSDALKQQWLAVRLEQALSRR